MSEIGATNSNSNNNNKPKGYLVDAQGYIVLPVIGKMAAARPAPAGNRRAKTSK
ncbi:MAG: hypothetical protein ACLSUW_09550 [Akkermansia sp.]